jgi:hypothetical protein
MYFMQIPSWALNNYSAGHNIPCLHGTSKFEVQEILTMKPIPKEVILVRMSKSYLHKIIIIIIIIIPGFSYQNSDPI